MNAAGPPLPCPSFIPGCGDIQIDDDYKENGLFEVVRNVLSYTMRLSASAAILMGVISGVMFLFAGGNEELKTKATKTIIYAGVGLLLSMFAFFIVELINRFNFSG